MDVTTKKRNNKPKKLHIKIYQIRTVNKSMFGATVYCRILQAISNATVITILLVFASGLPMKI